MKLKEELNLEFFNRCALIVAPEIIGWTFKVGSTGGMIIETEAYTREDPASHSFRGKTFSNSSMFGLPGTSYVYRSYGLHWCINFVCADASAVLIRALHPLFDIPTMMQRRGTQNIKALCSGPGKLSKALNINKDLDGLCLKFSPFHLIPSAQVPKIDTSRRIGITKAAEYLWRFKISRKAV